MPQLSHRGAAETNINKRLRETKDPVTAGGRSGEGRADGFGTLYGWLEARDMLGVKADRKEPLVVLPLRLAIEIATAVERGHKLGTHDLWGSKLKV